MATEKSGERRQRWQHIIEDWQASSKTQSEYCRDNALKLHQLNYWKRQLACTDTPSALIPLGPLPPVNSDNQGMLGVTLTNGTRLDIPANQAATLLPMIFTLLKLTP